MPSSMVDRATTDLLIGPDWAMNLEICDSLNREPGLAKDIVRGLKRRIGHKNPKVQLLALTLLETIIKNCGDMVHMHVAEKDLPHEMAKIVKKKPEFNVKEKILVLIDTWQETFGGPQARYPQFYAAYHELMRAGIVFPKRPEGSEPLHTPSKKQSLPFYPQSSSSDYQQPGASSGSDFPPLSLDEIQNARGIMDVLSEMLDALDPGNKEGLKQEVIRDLIHQCRSYKQRLVDLVNMTSDEDMLCQGLSLNDDMQNVLAKYDALAAGVAVRVEKTKSLQALVDIDDPALTNPCGSTASEQRSNSSTNNQISLQHLLIPGPPPPNGTATPSARTSPHIDLLSGDFNPPAAENPLALVPVSEPLASSATDQNALVLSDMFSQRTNNNGNNTPTSPFGSFSETSSAHAYPSSPHSTIYSNGSIPNSGVSQYEQFSYQGVPLHNTNQAWNGQGVQGMNLQQQPPNGLPPPPWETQPAESTQFVGTQSPRAQNGLPGGVMHVQITLSGQLGATPAGFVQSNQQAGMYQLQMHSGQQPGTFSQPMPGGGSQPGMHPSLMQNGQQLPGSYCQPNQGGHPAGYPGYAYDQRLSYPPYSNPNEISQGMYGLSIQDSSSYANANASPSYQTPTSPYVQQFKKTSKPEDSLFGDLVSMAKTKQNKTAGGGTGNL